MPFFQDNPDLNVSLQLDRSPADPEPEPILVDPAPPSTLRRLSEESLRTELCEGPVPDSPRHSPEQQTEDDDGITTSREELIEKLKRSQSPTWVAVRHLESIFQKDSPPRPKSTSRPSSRSSNLLPAAQITPEKNGSNDRNDSRLQDGLDIERPRSALHTGDFTTNDQERQKQDDKQRTGQRIEWARRSEGEWLATSPPRDYTPFQFSDHRRTFLGQSNSARSFGTSPLSLSPSLSSSLAYQPPTSPLAHSESNEELGISGAFDSMGFPASRSLPRRHTLYSAHSSPYASPGYPSSSFQPRLSLHRREGSFPSQAHQPRRSLTSTPSFMQPGSPQSASLPRSRRPSFSSESSPIQQHASMVGSYEESILRGRMSTTPSKPLDFMAEIGVLGLGNCKSRLRCPAHVTLPFAAVYYSYSSTPHGRSQSDDGPSPYVGQIDLENGLSNQADDSRLRRKAQNRYAERKPTDPEVVSAASSMNVDRESQRSSRSRRSSTTPRAPPGGSYRIPEKGQLQIIIKNQNKTAVKLFLVPYDLAGMEAGTKTFIRQRCYSAGPIIDSVPTAKDIGATDRPTLRYLVHLHICSPSKGRFYLYKSIRVVFANRVPDGKEKLRNETTWPEPRFTPYKPIRVMHPPPSASSGPAAALVADKAFRRRSSGLSFAPAAQAFDIMDGVQPTMSSVASSGFGNINGNANSHVPSLDPIPFRLPPRKRVTSEVSDTTNTTNTTATEMRSPESSQASRPSTKDSTKPWDSSRYAKLNKGDLGYGGYAFNQAIPGSPGVESLLSRRLRSLGTQSPSDDSPREGE